MKIIKPHRSVVENNKRKISVGAKTTQMGDIKSAADFLGSDERFFIAQWISILDKIFPKSNDKKPKQEIYDARDKLSKAFQRLWKEKEFNPDLSQWDKKVHPYKGPRNTDTRKVPHSYWYKVLIGKDIAINTINYDDVACNVYEHLYENQKNTQKLKGFIKNRAISIDNSVHKISVESNALNALSIEQKRHIEFLKDGFKFEKPSEYLLDKLIKSLSDKQELNSNKIQSRDAAKCLFAHYALVFGEKTKIQDKNGIIGLANEKHAKHKLWQYHSIIKLAIEQRYPRYNKKNKVVDIREQNLHNLAINIEKNKAMAFVVRLGKIIHYNQNESGDLSKLQNVIDIANSKCWTSDGQTQIKQKEAFVLQWLGALAAANASFQRLLDPNNELLDKYKNDGKLSEDERKRKINEIDFFSRSTINDTIGYGLDDGFDDRFNLLFGEDNELYKDNNSRGKLLRNIHKTISQIRNASFHFKGKEVFNNTLNENGISICEETNGYVKKQLKEQRKLIIGSLKSAHIEDYLPQNEVNLVLAEINNVQNKIILPKFSKLLKRSSNNSKQLIPAYNQAIQQQEHAKNCQFVVLKKLYESGFDDWLNNQDIGMLNDLVKEVMKYTTKQARKITRDCDATSKASKEIGNIENGQSLMQYFSYLTAKTASIFAVQNNVYDSNAKNAKQQAEFVENFKQDFLVLAFKSYLENKKLAFLLKLDKREKYEKTVNFSALKEQSMLENTWIYLILHLIPAQFVSSLSLQIRKYHVLKGEIIFPDIAKAIDMYLSMHNAIHQDATLKNTELKKFYDNENDFASLFGNEQNNRLIPVKGLRELLRFGNISQLRAIFADYKITTNHINTFNDCKINIANEQKEKADLHQELCQNKSRINNKKKQYKKALEAVEKYGHLKNHIHLHNHQKIHQLIMTIAGRFVGFSHLWERDIYFVMCGLLLINGTPIEDALTNKLIKNGQILAALRKLNGEIYKKLDRLFFIERNSKIRNNFAHFNGLRKNEIELTKMLNNARTLMSYDRKLKNSVAKSIINIIAKENLDIEFEIKKGQDSRHILKLKKITNQPIKHFEKNDIIEKIHDDEYVKVMEKLFKSDV